MTELIKYIKMEELRETKKNKGSAMVKYEVMSFFY